MHDSSLLPKILTDRAYMPRKKPVIHVQDIKHNVKQNHPVYHHQQQHCCQRAARPREGEKVLGRHILQCPAHPSIKGCNEYHSQQKGCIYKTWEVMGEKEYQMKVLFYMCSIPE